MSNTMPEEQERGSRRNLVFIIIAIIILIILILLFLTFCRPPSGPVATPTPTEEVTEPPPQETEAPTEEPTEEPEETATPEVTEAPAPTCSCDGPDRVCDDGTVTQNDEECRAACACDGPDLYCGDELFREDDGECRAACGCVGPDLYCNNEIFLEGYEECRATCACDGPDLYCQDDTVVFGYEDCLAECVCDGYDFYCGDVLEEANSAQCGYTGECILERTCGNGVCDTACENTDLCPADCQCVDDGTCAPGEGVNCRDCQEGGNCGAPCATSEQCVEGLSCFQAVCWESCECGGNCGEPPPPVTCRCIDIEMLIVECSDGTRYTEDYESSEYCIPQGEY